MPARSDTPQEPIDLTPEQRDRIDALFGQLRELDDHGVIGVPPGSDAATIRRAYYQRVAEFHPDRFFRKQVGSYRSKIDAITQRITEAYEALAAARPKERRDSPPPPAEATRSPTISSKPPSRPSPKAEQALRALKRQLDARRDEAKRLADEAAASDGYPRKAEMEERLGHWDEAVCTWRLVAESRPTDARGHERLAIAILKAGGDVHEAARAAAKAVELEPHEPRLRKLLARAQAARRAET